MSEFDCFKKLVETLKKKKPHNFRWCPIRRDTIKVIQLDVKECFNCELFITRENGVCDPI